MTHHALAIGAIALALGACTTRTVEREVIHNPPTAAQSAPAAAAPAPAPAAVVVTTVAPPPLQPEVVPSPPASNMVWIPGYWNWSNNQYTWVPGRYEPAKVGYRWVPTRWEYSQGRWQMTAGTWVRD
jgi:hypothetical protein